MNAETAAKPLIVGVDGSVYSCAALRFAGSLAARLGTRLEVRHGEDMIKSPMGSVTKAFAAHSTCRVLLVGQEADTV